MIFLYILGGWKWRMFLSARGQCCIIEGRGKKTERINGYIASFEETVCRCAIVYVMLMWVFLHFA